MRAPPLPWLAGSALFAGVVFSGTFYWFVPKLYHFWNDMMIRKLLTAAESAEKDDSIVLLLRAKKKGSLDAYYQLGLILLAEGDENGPNPSLALKYFKYAANRGHSPSMFQCYLLLRSNRYSIDQNTSLADAWFLKAIAVNNVDAQVEQAKLFLRYPSRYEDSISPKKAINSLELGKKHGNKEAIRILAYLYASGTYVILDEKEAKKLYHMAATLGDTVSKQRIREAETQGHWNFTNRV